MDRLLLVVWRPHTTIILTIGLVLILIGIFVSFTVSAFRPTTEVSIGSGMYAMWVAQTEPDLKQGLSGVENLKPNNGLLMDFGESGLHGIWMKDMNFPLDIVWLDKNNKVVYIVKNAPPESPVSTIYAPKEPAWYVLELPAGSVQKAGIQTGMVAEFKVDV
jgi:uncharacterized membrane protein (UPF0127 family)